MSQDLWLVCLNFKKKNRNKRFFLKKELFKETNRSKLASKEKQFSIFLEETLKNIKLLI